MDEKIFKDLSDINEQELLDKKPSKIKKVIVIFIGFFLLILMVSYFYSFPLFDIISSRLESKPILNNTINLDNISIIFSDDSFTLLQEIYFNNQKTEFSACLSGKKSIADKIIYDITSLYEPKIYSRSLTHVSFKPCSQETLIILHSHPYKRCLASGTDLETLEKTKELNQDVLMVIMCEPSRFSVYS